MKNNKEKTELEQTTKDWFEKAQARVNYLKKMATMAVKEDREPENVDERTKGLIHMLISINESRERRKRELKKLMDDIGKESKERRNKVKKIINDSKKEREEMRKMWQRVTKFTTEKRRELNEKRGTNSEKL